MAELNMGVEYIAFAVMLGVSVIVGLYYAFVERKQNTVKDYLLGGKDMPLIPVIMSLIASHISGITMLGVPCEMYSFGTQFLISGVVHIISALVIEVLFLPVFYELQFTSVYEYLEHRFDSSVRGLMSLIYALSFALYIPVVVYIPALAFNQVTGLDVQSASRIICVTCIFYTTVGGLKAVVWTDTIRSFFTAIALSIVVVAGISQIGGFGNMIRANLEGGRIEFFRMDPDPFLRNTFWTISIGSLVNTITYLGLSPGTVQRFVSLPTYKKARKSLLFYMFGIGMVVMVTGIIGMLIYATYKDCDPSTANYIDSDRHLLPFYVMKVAAKYPGVTGLFVSGLVSTALSTMSAQLNTVSGTIYEDLIVKMMGMKFSELTASVIMKCTVVVMGVVCLVLVSVVERLSGILQMAISINSVTIGPILSVFTLGVCFPCVNTRGAKCAILFSTAIMMWIVFGAQFTILNNDLKFVKKDVSIDGCPDDIVFKNLTDFSGLYRMNDDVYVNPDVWKIFTVSYMYYGTIGAVVGLTVGLVVSLAFPTEQDIDPRLLTPFVRKLKFPEYVAKDKADGAKSDDYKLESQITPL